MQICLGIDYLSRYSYNQHFLVEAGTRRILINQTLLSKSDSVFHLINVMKIKKMTSIISFT